MGINAGDIITVVGPKSSYNGNPRLKDVTVEDHKAVTDATLSEFIAAEVAEDVWYRLTGTVDNIYNTEYGNFHLLDDAGNDVVVYGLVAGWGGPSKEFASLGIQEGDVITIVGVRDEFNVQRNHSGWRRILRVQGVRLSRGACGKCRGAFFLGALP